MPEPRVETACWQDSIQRQALESIRRQVFMQEQGVSAELEWDGLDPEAVHFLAYDEAHQAIACARLLHDGQLGRMAVLQNWRARGIGRRLMQALLNYAEQYHYPPLFLHAQIQAQGFYKSFGFEAEGNIFDDAGIPHITMRRK